MYSIVPCIKYDNGLMVPSSHKVVMEVPLSVFVNGRHALTAMVSPTMLEEFVTGFLCTERIICKLEDIESLRLEEKKNKNLEENGTITLSASVLTKNPFSIMFSSKTVLSGCRGDTSYLDADRLPKIQSDLITDVLAIKSIMKKRFCQTCIQEQAHTYCRAFRAGRKNLCEKISAGTTPLTR